jgi:hypothetical protein
MNDRPAVNVVIPTHNHEKLLPIAAESVPPLGVDQCEAVRPRETAGD